MPLICQHSLLDIVSIQRYAYICYTTATYWWQLYVRGKLKKTKKDLNADQLWEIAWTYIRTVVDTAREPFLILDDKLNVLSANALFYSFFHTTKEKTEEKLVYALGNGQWNIPKLKILLEDIIPKNSHFEDFRVDYAFPIIGHKILMLNARQIFSVKTNQPIILLAMEDITKQIQLEFKMKEFTKELMKEVAKRTAELEIRVKELERINKIMIGREIRMIELKAEVAKLKKALKR